jgi:hypothetical protein
MPDYGGGLLAETVSGLELGKKRRNKLFLRCHRNPVFH